ncbi:hypothetical protein CAPTEDRAFT_134237 [Capitella teleta]|uniref:SAP domain-containing protein n=1 Tax=Capitella teleta TaxID=283909 RepID=R7VG19_CAPTE|nr:hypothetical protein CAPTEDRAFT_134237 [Capitella teleta]|eukprot:ELU14625.1 hypothetical protein CAPTEDRAFT_134237 [Capitella teleta]
MESSDEEVENTKKDESEDERVENGKSEEGAKRQRKKVDRIEVSAASSNVDKAPTIKEGRGARLGEIPYVEAQLNKVVGAELKPLHKLLFGRIGAVTEVKRNIKRFNGYEFEKDSADYQKKLAILKASTLAGLKGLSQTLGLERSGTKDVLMERIMEFLLKPKDFGKSVPGSKKRWFKYLISSPL